MVDTIVPFSEMGRVAPGFAYLESLDVQDLVTVAELKYSNGTALTVSLPATPRVSSTSPLPSDVLAVRISRGLTVEVTALMKAGSERRHRRLSLDEALALAQAGIHTTFVTRTIGTRGANGQRLANLGPVDVDTYAAS